MESLRVIQTEALSKTYRRRNGAPVQAVQDLTLAVPSGQVFGFLGPNGAGKTTTIKMICGLVRPTSGRVSVGEYDVWRRRSAAVRQIGAVLEGTRNVHWPLSAWDNLLYFGHLKGMWGKTLAARTEQLLRELDLWERRKDLVRTFSRGMQQKVAVACALVADPPIVLLDEPTLGLDVQAARVVKDMIGQLARKDGKTVVLTTHQMDTAEELCDHVAIISKGRLIAHQPVQELLGLFSEEYYQIEVEGYLPAGAASLFDDMTVEEKNGHAILSGPVADRMDLYRALGRLYELNLPLISVSRAEPDLEEVFVRLLDTSTEREGGRDR
ncbi:MAG: ABC transporter ATP-binding protein [Anaerolineae bacterium]|nr:MAG: ABC transporter ATP-binding protein [Anaerolineae bacterium]